MSEQKKTEKNRKGGKIVFAGCAVIIVMLLEDAEKTFKKYGLME